MDLVASARKGQRTEWGKGTSGKHGGYSLAFSPMIWICPIYPMVSHVLTFPPKWVSKKKKMELILIIFT